MNTNCAWCVNVLALGSRLSCWSILPDKLVITFDHLELLGRIWQKLRCCLTTWSAHLSMSPETGIISQAGRLPVRIPYHRRDFFYSWLPELFLNNLRVSNWQPFMALVVLACRTVRRHGSGNREVSLWECSHAHVTVSNKRTTNTGRLHPRHATSRSQFPDEIRYAWLHSYVELSPGLIAVVCVHW